MNPKTLGDLARVLRTTADAHRDLALALAEYHMLSAVVANVHRLAEQIEETAKQIERGDYGDPRAAPE